MKRLLLPLLLLVLATPVYAFGKYNSQVEAKEACKKWADKGLNILLKKQNGQVVMKGMTMGAKLN